MTYLLSQLWLYLFCVGLLGLLLGWVIWGWGSRRQIAKVKAGQESARLEMQRVFDSEKSSWTQTLEKEQAATAIARDETGKARLSLTTELERERKATAEAKAQIGRLNQADWALRQEAEREKTELESKLDTERKEASEAREAISRFRTQMTGELEAKQAALAKAEATAENALNAAMTENKSVGQGSDNDAAGQVRLAMTETIDEERRATVLAKAEAERLARAEREARAEIARLEAEVSRLKQKEQGDFDGSTHLRRALDESRLTQRSLEDEIAKLRASLNAQSQASSRKASAKFTTDAPKPATLFDRRPDIVDDLKEVKGIGPVMEGILNENGCYHFKQLANFSSRDIEWISAALGSFPDRIARDEWVDQAQTLYARKYGQRHDVGEADQVRTLVTSS